MRLLVTVFEKLSGPGSILLVEDGDILVKKDYKRNLRGLAKLNNEHYVIDKKGFIYTVNINNLNLKNVTRITGIEDAHDLRAYGEELITSCTARSYAKDTKSRVYTPFLTSPVTMNSLDINHQDLYHMNSFVPYKDGFLISVFSTVPYKDDSRWRDRNSQGAIIYWSEYGFQDVLAGNLSQPHSIRPIGGKVYFCNSRHSTVFNGEKFVRINPTGFIRGLDIKDNIVVAGHSKSRVMNTGKCGYSLVNKDKFFELKGNFREVYDIKIV